MCDEGIHLGPHSSGKLSSRFEERRNDRHRRFSAAAVFLPAALSIIAAPFAHPIGAQESARAEDVLAAID